MTYFLVIVACILVYFCHAEGRSDFEYTVKDPVDFKACIVWMRDCVSSESIVKSVDAYLVPVLEKHMKKEKSEERFPEV